MVSPQPKGCEDQVFFQRAAGRISAACIVETAIFADRVPIESRGRIDGRGGGIERIVFIDSGMDAPCFKLHELDLFK